MRLLHSLAVAGPVAALLATTPVAPNGGTTFDAGTTPESVDLRDAGGAVSYDGGFAIPLAGAKPDWFSDDVEQRAIAAGGQPVLAPEDAPLPSTVGIRPGAWMVSPAGCTMNFVFSNEDGDLGIGTAGHCVEEEGQRVVLLTLAPGAGDAVLVDVGSVVAVRDNGVGNDFALVRIRPELLPWVSSTTAVIGGPCGHYEGSGPETVAHYGHGVGIGTGGTPRAGVALTWHEDAYGWDGAAIFGDSGSPVRVTALEGAGNLTHLVVDGNWLPSMIAGTRVSRMLQIADGWSLVDSALCTFSTG